VSVTLITLGPALVLAFLHQWATYLHPRKYIARKYWLSFADGISITYIFLQLPPEIIHIAAETDAVANRPYTLNFTDHIEQISIWRKHHSFAPLLIGFSLFYGLEKWIGKPSPHENKEASRLSIHFRVHCATHALENACWNQTSAIE
jgi:hypothetical protein